MASGNSTKGRTASQKNKKKPNISSNEQAWACVGCESAFEIENGGDSIECHNCKKWCHRECSGLSSRQFDCLQGGGNFLLWVCSTCREVQSEPQSRVESKLDTVLKMLESLTTRLNKIETDQAGVTPEAIEGLITQKVEEKVGECLEELKEKESRKLNIIVNNLPESHGTSIDDQRVADLQKVRGMVTDIIGEVAAEDISSPMRLGPIKIGQAPHPRPLKLTIKKPESKEKILRNARKLNNGKEPSQRVYFNDDYTPRERDLHKKLRLELRARREKGETNIMINYKTSKIVERRDTLGDQPRAAPSGSQ